MRKVLKFVSSRVFVTCVCIALQISFIIYLIYYLSSYSMYIQFSLTVLSLIITVIIINKNDNPMFKLSWIVPILVFPVFGWFLYLVFEKRQPFGMSEKFNKIFDSEEYMLDQDESVSAELADKPDICSQIKYISNSASAVAYNRTETKFYECGKDFYSDFIKKISSAEKFIFMEYFIIGKGHMWNEVYEKIKQKAESGVEVRILFDDMGCIMFNKKYRNEMKRHGIYTAAFNPLKPSLDVFINYRDHRKITIIDGTTAFTGGINISDEYINLKERFGYWKDSVLMIHGDAVTSMTNMFVQMWNFCCSDTIERDKYITACKTENDGYVQPFGDRPGDIKQTGEMAYMKIINSALRYVYITTPYLIPDNEMITALCLAAQSGVDVRIITPHIPDKWYVQTVTRSNYSVLINSGIKIYEFIPGFIHSKTIVSDDSKGIAGTSNFDFRSFYLLFENGVFMYKSSAVMQMKNDFERTLELCEEINYSKCRRFPLIVRVTGAVLKLFSPLM